MSHQGLCENILNILKLLSEEIFDFSSEQMTSFKTKQLKEAMNNQFQSIFTLCEFVLKTYMENANQVKKALIKSCLKTFSSFLSWVPYGYIFETDIIEILLTNFFGNPSFRNETLPCLVEIASLKIEDTEPK